MNGILRQKKKVNLELTMTRPVVISDNVTRSFQVMTIINDLQISDNE
jgi:hypothetical protein